MHGTHAWRCGRSSAKNFQQAGGDRCAASAPYRPQSHYYDTYTLLKTQGAALVMCVAVVVKRGSFSPPTDRLVAQKCLAATPRGRARRQRCRGTRGQTTRRSTTLRGGTSGRADLGAPTPYRMRRCAPHTWSPARNPRTAARRPRCDGRRARSMLNTAQEVPLPAVAAAAQGIDAPVPVLVGVRPGVAELQAAIESLTARNAALAALNAGLEQQLAAVKVQCRWYAVHVSVGADGRVDAGGRAAQVRRALICFCCAGRNMGAARGAICGRVAPHFPTTARRPCVCARPVGKTPPLRPSVPAAPLPPAPSYPACPVLLTLADTLPARHPSYYSTICNYPRHVLRLPGGS